MYRLKCPRCHQTYAPWIFFPPCHDVSSPLVALRNHEGQLALQAVADKGVRATFALVAGEDELSLLSVDEESPNDPPAPGHARLRVARADGRTYWLDLPLARVVETAQVGSEVLEVTLP